MLPSPKPKVVVHQVAPLKPCFPLGLATVPTGSKGTIPAVFYFLFSQGLGVPGTAYE